MVMDQYAEFTGEKLDNKFMRITAPIDYSLAFTPAVYENVSKSTYEGSYVKSTYVYNLWLMASKLKELREKGQDIELRTFLQSVGNWTGMRDMVSIGDFRMQIYTELAFGSHEFIYYEFGNFYSQEEGEFALFDLKNNKFNWTFDCAAKVNNEVHAFEDAYLAYNWDGVMYQNGDEIVYNPAFEFIEDYAIQKHPRIKIKSCDEDTLIGTFKHLGKPVMAVELILIISSLKQVPLKWMKTSLITILMM